MQTVTLGRTGLEVGVAGLGCGGHSRLGLGTGGSPEDCVELVRGAIDMGVNFIDTTAVYGTEEVVGAAIKGRRDEVVISTKLQIVKPGTSVLGDDYISGADYARGLEDCLRRLGTDHVDILHLHGVMPEQYFHCVVELVPALMRLREQGKIRYLGLTERFIYDPQHRMLTQALQDDHWDVVMTGFNLVNASARKRVFTLTREKDVGTLIMFAVRRALSVPEALTDLIEELIGDGMIDGSQIDHQDPLGFLISDGGAASVVEAAYRFCRHEPGAHVVLTGTGKLEYLRQNVTSIQAGPLAPAALRRAERVFGGVDSVSGN